MHRTRDGGDDDDDDDHDDDDDDDMARVSHKVKMEDSSASTRWLNSRTFTPFWIVYSRGYTHVEYVFVSELKKIPFSAW